MCVAVSASGDGANTSNGPKAIVAVLHHGPGGDGGDEADLFVVRLGTLTCNVHDFFHSFSTMTGPISDNKTKQMFRCYQIITN